MTYKTSQMSVCVCVHPSIHHWADVDEIFQIYSMALVTQLLGSRISATALHGATLNFAQSGEMPSPAGVHIYSASWS